MRGRGPKDMCQSHILVFITKNTRVVKKNEVANQISEVQL
jgi:hypothetical protein